MTEVDSVDLETFLLPPKYKRGHVSQSFSGQALVERIWSKKQQFYKDWCCFNHFYGRHHETTPYTTSIHHVGQPVSLFSTVLIFLSTLVTNSYTPASGAHPDSLVFLTLPWAEAALPQSVRWGSFACVSLQMKCQQAGATGKNLWILHSVN